MTDLERIRASCMPGTPDSRAVYNVEEVRVVVREADRLAAELNAERLATALLRARVAELEGSWGQVPTAALRAELDRRRWAAEADRETGGPDPYADVLGSMP